MRAGLRRKKKTSGLLSQRYIEYLFFAITLTYLLLPLGKNSNWHHFSFEPVAKASSGESLHLSG